MIHSCKRLLPLLMILALGLNAAEVVEEIYAVVNDEAITASDLLKYEQEMVRSYQGQLEGEKLEQALKDLHKNLLQQVIEQKLLESKVKEKNYNVDADVEFFIQDIRKQNNIASDEDLKKALSAEGLDYSTWKEMWRNRFKQEQLIREEVGAKIKIDNAQIMTYYRQHEKDFTLPAEYTVSAIFFKKEGDTAALAQKMVDADAALAAQGFDAVAKTFSQLPDAEKPGSLGKFHPGELDKPLNEALLKLNKKGERSGWVETDSGFYKLELADYLPSRLKQMQEVREEITQRLRVEQQPPRLKEFIEQLRQASYIKIYKEYNAG
jgi:parvulin-like peptidyl-prolyl isomerase